MGGSSGMGTISITISMKSKAAFTKNMYITIRFDLFFTKLEKAMFYSNQIRLKKIIL
jgi:hypothetical protein